MIGLFKRLFGQKDLALEDAQRIYSKLMSQSRMPRYYGTGKVPDNYDGRIDFLTLHIAIVLEKLRQDGEQGERLSQAIYDAMKDDFEIAMREEGLSDTGIKRRIKPMMQLFFDRIKTYVEAIENKVNINEVLAQGLLVEGHENFRIELASYVSKFSHHIRNKSLGEVALGDFEFPK